MSVPALEGRRVAALTIDLHRGHLDPEVATMPLPAEAAARVTADAARFLHGARERGVPVFHVVTSYRDETEISANPWWAAVAGSDASRAGVLGHQLPGSPGLELMPDVHADGDLVIDSKKRYDCFLGTDLELSLRAHGVETLLVLGVNTNSCVLATSIAASVRDFAVVVVREGVATMDAELHEPALACLGQAFGWVMHGDDVLAAL